MVWQCVSATTENQRSNVVLALQSQRDAAMQLYVGSLLEAVEEYSTLAYSIVHVEG